MRKVASLLIMSLLIGITTVYAQGKPVAVYAVAFYNLENLFDTIHQPEVNDIEFTPAGSMKWGTMKYNNKLHNLAYAISKLATDKYCPQGPAIIGVSEIENRTVLEDLIKTGELANRNYGIVHYDSPDRRGVDVGLLYDKNQFRVDTSTSVRLYVPEFPNMLTRDQLVVSGHLAGEPDRKSVV